MILLLLLIFIVSACSDSGNGTGTNNNSATAATSNVSTPTVAANPTSQVHLGTQPCPEAVKNPSYWDTIVPTQPNINNVENVLCANLRGNSTLQALVTVRYAGTGRVLDVYVYDDIIDPQPQQLFKLQGLYKGDARMSSYNTLMTAEVDQASALNKGRSNAALRQDLFREFSWSDGTGTLVPVAFPGIFPDLTRYQAEDAQQGVNHGNQPWRLSATRTAQALAANLLKWDANAPATIISGGGEHDLNAMVSVKSTFAGGGMITVKLSRLEGNSQNGIWEATAVTSPEMTISVPQERDRLSSPAVVTGTGKASEGKVGKVVVLDHLYSSIGEVEALGANGDGATTFSTSVSYASTFTTGIQEGVVALYSYSNANGPISGAVMVKEMLG